MKNIFFILITSLSLIRAQSPRCVFTIVIDQFSFDELQRLAPFMHGGLKKLYTQGVVYTNAFHPHGMPETGPGHATIGTGAYAKDHGIVANKFPLNGKFIACDDDELYGKSAHNIRVDTLADQLMLANSPHIKNTIYSLSLKSRAAIGMSGRLGNPIWFDGNTGQFISSKAFFKELPNWLTQFNKEKNIAQMTDFTWQLAYPHDYAGYQFPLIDNYECTRKNCSIINKTIKVEAQEKTLFDMFMKTPQANQLLIDLASRCFMEHKPQDHTQRLILNVSLSGLDKIGHMYGPQSKEAIDMLYHMDRQLGEFMDNIFTQIDPEDTLFILTADHGVSPILQNIHMQGLEFAQLRSSQELTTMLNNALEQKFNKKNLIQKITMPYVYLNRELINHLDQDSINQMVKKQLQALPFVQDIWTADELIQLPTAPDDIRRTLQNQQFKGERCGDLIMLLQPYNFITKYTTGTSHVTPYNNDRHVPLIVYQPSIHENKRINERVCVSQIPITIAYLLDSPRPSATQADPLPGIIKKEEILEKNITIQEQNYE